MLSHILVGNFLLQSVKTSFVSSVIHNHSWVITREMKILYLRLYRLHFCGVGIEGSSKFQVILCISRILFRFAILEVKAIISCCRVAESLVQLGGDVIL